MTREELERRIASAPTEELREKYLAELRALDLPAARPTFSHDAAGARVAVGEGQVLAGRYEIRRRLGAGGMGAVFAALDRNRNEEIAIKVMLPGLIEKPGARERFESEAKLSIKLSHQNIVKVFDVQENFITMELLEGQTLRSAMKRFPVDEVVRIGRALCEALGYAHKFTVHRDVKPENPSTRFARSGQARNLS